MKITTDHLPFRLASVTSTNLPLWKAWALNGWTWVLIRDMGFSPWLKDFRELILERARELIQLRERILPIGRGYGVAWFALLRA